MRPKYIPERKIMKKGREKVKRKLIATMLAMALLLTACGKSGDETAAKPEREQDGGEKRQQVKQ